jgi:hypothetical protein
LRNQSNSDIFVKAAICLQARFAHERVRRGSILGLKVSYCFPEALCHLPYENCLRFREYALEHRNICCLLSAVCQTNAEGKVQERKRCRSHCRRCSRLSKSICSCLGQLVPCALRIIASSSQRVLFDLGSRILGTNRGKILLFEKPIRRFRSTVELLVTF